MVNYPDDWELKNAGEFVRVIRGVSYKDSDVHHARRNNDCMILRGGNIIDGGNINIMADDNVYVSRSLISESQTLRKNDVVIVASTASMKVIGKSSIVDKDYNNIAPGAFLLLLRPIQNENTFTPYIASYFRTNFYRENIKRLVAGGVIQNIKQDYITNMQIPLPPLHEQQAIADTLSVFDTHITNLAELITKKKAIRYGALEDLMSGRTRLKGFSGDWEVKKLGEVASIQDGTHGTFARVQLGKLLLSAKNVFNNHLVITDNESMVSQSDYNKIIANGYPRKGDILISCVGTIGRCCLLERDDVAFQRSVAFIRPHKFYNKYLMFLLQSRSIQQQLTALINASAQGGVYLNSLKQINLLATTDEDEQQAIADTLSALDDEIASLEAERDKITQIRDGAMNDLLTGKVRLLNGN